MDWKAIKSDYIAGGTSYRKLAEKYGVSFNTLKTHAIEEQWHKLRQQKEHKTTTKIVETIINNEVQNAVDIIAVADTLLVKIVEVAASVSDPDSIKKLTSAIKDLRDIKGIKSEADMREQEARIDKLRKEAEADTNYDNEIKVIIEGNLTDYSK